MSVDLNMNGTNAIAKGTVVYEKGEPVQSVALIVKGRVSVQANGVKTILGSGNFLGMCDTKEKIHSFTYIALDDLVVYGLPIGDEKQAALLLDEKPQYRGLLVTSVNFFMRDIYKAFLRLQKEAKEARKFVFDLYEKYLALVENSGLLPEKMMSIQRLQSQEMEEYILPEKTAYYMECCNIPVEAQKNFFGGNASVAKFHFAEQCSMLPSLVEGCNYYGEWLNRLFRILIMDEKNLFGLIGKMALGVKKSGQQSGELSAMLDSLLEAINNTETTLLDVAGMNPDLDRARMEEVYFALLSDDTDAFVGEEDELEVLEGSLHQILEYAAVDAEIADEFEAAVEKFLGFTDKFARTPEIAAVRKKITEHYFTIYESVVKKSFRDAKPPLAVKLFLRYGYVSEELLTASELRTLIQMPHMDNANLDCKVYTMDMWLKEIYEGRKNPSKDEFDTDFEEMLRKEAAEGKRDKTKLQEAFMNPDDRLHFEIMKFMRYAIRIVNGNISLFVPILCSEGIYTRLETAIVKGAALNSAVRKVEKVDYSIFYREQRMSFEAAEINNFSAVERYAPDFIIFPVYGRGGIMWQDIEGKHKNTHARILMPAILEKELEQEVLKLLAYFRWEKCRTDMGANWNNYRYPSLTSEYTDYLQFYKKNSDLSPERKEKVKAQLQSCNNKHREVFSKDYQDWVMREAVGAMKLNRVARGIVYTYCPLSSEVAEGLLTQNSYAEAAKRHKLEMSKLEKNITTVIRKFEKMGLDIPSEVEQTRKYWLEV